VSFVHCDGRVVASRMSRSGRCDIVGGWKPLDGFFFLSEGRPSRVGCVQSWFP